MSIKPTFITTIQIFKDTATWGELVFEFNRFTLLLAFGTFSVFSVLAQDANQKCISDSLAVTKDTLTCTLLGKADSVKQRLEKGVEQNLTFQNPLKLLSTIFSPRDIKNARSADFASRTTTTIEDSVNQLAFSVNTNNITIEDTELDLNSRVQGAGEFKGLEIQGSAETIKESINTLNENGRSTEDVLQAVVEIENPTGNLKIPDAESLSKQTGNKLENFSGVDELKKEAQALEQMKAVRAKWTDPEVAKEEALNKAKQSAVNHFAGHTEELQATMKQLADLKAKHPHAQGVLDLFAKRQQPLKGVPFVERLLPGLTFQIQKSNSVLLDLNPSIGLKLSGRFIAGLGWNHRLAYDFHAPDWDRKSSVYGVRSFVHFKLLEGFYLKTDAELIHARKRPASLNAVELKPKYDWGWNYFAGIKKDFQLGKRFKWNTQLLYNIYSTGGLNPYVNRLNVRFGFEIPIVKRSKVAKQTTTENK